MLTARRSFPVVFLAFVTTLLLATTAFAQTSLTVTPDTTLAAETGNNTSASPTFAAASDGNAAGSSNVSKVPIRSLLYAGSTSKIYAHFEPWYGGTNHLNVGYSSADAAQVHQQALDMVSRGIQGAIVDWYGPNFSTENATTQFVKAEAEAQGGAWNFALLYDSGALNQCATTAGCNLTQQLIADLQYASQNYLQSPAYIHVNGQPVILFFGVDQFAIDWTTVRSSVSGNPLFVFEYESASNPGFTHAQSSGAFGWQAVNTSNPGDTGLAYLDAFYTAANSNGSLLAYGSGYKGFNDSLAPWAPNPARIMSQNCGQTWLASLAEAGKFFSTSNQLEALQLVTWNDYEEGTEIETGIDNCVTISASTSGATLNWTVGGSESTIDHYTVFISQDGTNLMTLKDVAAGTHSFDLSQYTLAAGTYQLFVKAVGKPSLTNHMSAAVAYNPSDKPPVAQLTVSPTSGAPPLTVNASTSGSTDPDGTIASSNIDFGDGSTAVSGATASHTYNTAGSYVVTATVTDNAGLSSTAQTTVTVGSATTGPQAVLNVTPTSGGVPLAVSASLAGSTDSGGTITSYKFTWGDGSAATTSSSATATHTYNAAGSYTVTGTVTDNNGKTSTATQSVTAVTSGVTITTPANGATVTSPVNIAASASSAVAPITSMAIYVDGVSQYSTFSNSLNTSLPMSIGSHLLVVQAWDGSGNVYKSSVTITVSSQTADKPPVVSLSVTPTSGAAPLAVTASTSGSTDPDGTVTSSTINWGDGTVVSGPTAQHTYQTAGTFTVTATVFDNANLSSTRSATVTATGSTPPPTCTAPCVAISSPASGSTVTSPVHVVATGYDTGATITTMQIYLDGKLVYSIKASLIDTTIAAATGAHTVTVKEWDSASHSYMSAVKFTVGTGSTNQPPVAVLSVTPASGAAPLNVTASTSGSSDPDGTIASSTINWGDGATSPGPTAQHTYNSAGTFIVTGTVTDNGGLTASNTATVTATSGSTVGSPHAVLSVSPTSGSAPLAVSGSLANSTDTGGTITGYSLAWGDGTSSTGSAASHTYNSAGSFTVTGTVTDNTGATSSATATVTVTSSTQPPPTCTAPCVTITSPANGVTVPSPVTISGYGTTTSGATVKLTQIYIDGVKKAEVAAGSISYSAVLPAGSHKITVQCEDSLARWFKSSVTVTVQ